MWQFEKAWVIRLRSSCRIEKVQRVSAHDARHKNRECQMADISKIEGLVFYAVDRGSPFPLRMQAPTDEFHA